jgi:hypothetical protein
MAKVIWKSEPDAHDYPAATAYLSLLVDDTATIDRVVAALGKSAVVNHKAKDILRAAQLPLLPKTNPHVASDLRRIQKGKALSPVLLVQGDLARGFPLQIADGYHRVCASYLTAEDTDIPCRLVPLPAARPAAARAKATPPSAAAGQRSATPPHGSAAPAQRPAAPSRG